jgi:hypothetical protein
MTDFNKPILVGWQSSKASEFIREYKWFFIFDPRMKLFSLYTLLLIYLPMGLSLTVVNSQPWSALIFTFSVVHLLLAIILINAALEV